MTTIISGDSGITFPNSTEQASAGQVLQVVNANKTDTFTSSANATWTDITGVTVTITPKFTTSKILISLSMFGVFWQQGYNGVILRLLRNGTNIAGGDASGSRSPCIGTSVAGTAALNTDSGVQFHFSFVDSPATTSAVTYKIQFWQDSPSLPIYVNRTRGDVDSTVNPRTSTSIIAQEIAG